MPLTLAFGAGLRRIIRPTYSLCRPVREVPARSDRASKSVGIFDGLWNRRERVGDAVGAEPLRPGSLTASIITCLLVMLACSHTLVAANCSPLAQDSHRGVGAGVQPIDLRERVEKDAHGCSRYADHNATNAPVCVDFLIESA